MVPRRIKRGQTMMKMPEHLILSTKTVLDSVLGPYIENAEPQLSTIQAITTFLIYQKHLGDTSFWKPYLDVLPEEYTHPVYFSEEDFLYLPHSLRANVKAKKQECIKSFEELKPFFPSLEPLLPEWEDIFTFDAFRWAWCTVKTRSLYVDDKGSTVLRNLDKSGLGVTSLVPMVDLLNHSHSARTGLLIKKSCKAGNYFYTVTAEEDYGRGDQVLFCYRRADNQTLLLNYGFVLPDNHLDLIKFFLVKDIIGILELMPFVEEEDPKFRRRKVLLIATKYTASDLTCDYRGVSRTLMTVMRILVCDSEDRPLFKKVLADDLPWDHPVAVQARSLARELLERRLLSYGIMDDEAILRESNTPVRHLVVAMRNEEKKILQKGLKSLNNERHE
ncbi:SET domain-containing protein 4-like [Branchiostoma lanceolatum]|uniref:SET domain-containing protein 4-like n=1 Tax=Branchiostoma lanceolatum TaxID=7740 RepID=UPI003452E43A